MISYPYWSNNYVPATVPIIIIVRMRITIVVKFEHWYRVELYGDPVAVAVHAVGPSPLSPLQHRHAFKS